MVSPTIRPAHSSEVGDLAALRSSYAQERKGVSAAADPGFDERFDEWYRSTEATSRWQVAVIGPVTVGAIHMFVLDRMPMPGYDTGGWGYISLLYVRPDHRGRGLGTRLLAAAEQTAIGLGLSKLLLHPTAKAVPLYQRCGYSPAGAYMVHDLTSSD